jgi:SOH1
MDGIFREESSRRPELTLVPVNTMTASTTSDSSPDGADHKQKRQDLAARLQNQVYRSCVSGGVGLAAATSGGESKEGPASSGSPGGRTSDSDTPAAPGDASISDLARFQYELEFIQALSAPAYLHFLATSPAGAGAEDDISDDVGEHPNEAKDEKQDQEDQGMQRPKSSKAATSALLLDDAKFRIYLQYLYHTWSRPEYARFLLYPHCLYFLQILLENPEVVGKGKMEVGFESF